MRVLLICTMLCYAFPAWCQNREHLGRIDAEGHQPCDSLKVIREFDGTQDNSPENVKVICYELECAGGQRHIFKKVIHPVGMIWYFKNDISISADSFEKELGHR